MSAVQPFKHDPLDLTQAWVRVIDILPQQPDGAIRCRLSHAALNPSLRFSAVSYEWGSLGSEKQQIYVNDLCYQVHHNLFLFLNSLLNIHSTVGYQGLWIDAICINQLDIKEKNRQVQQMRQVYEMADNVWIWLGAAGDGSDALFDFLQDLYSTDLAENATVTLARLTEEQWKHYQNQIFCAGVDIWRACEALSKRTYWTRVWILQEIFLAKQPLILCGNKKILWQPWAIVLDTLKSSPSLTRSVAPSISQSHAMSICRQWFAPIDEVPSDDLLQLVLIFGESYCSIPHDKVYGLHGLVPGASTVQVDYECDLEKLFLDLLETTNLEITISDIDRLLYLFDVENPLSSSELGYKPKNTNSTKEMSTRGLNQMATLHSNWKLGELYTINETFRKSLSSSVMRELSHRHHGGVMRRNCPQCSSKLHTDTPGSRVYQGLSKFSYTDKVRDLEGHSTALLYRELSGKGTYFGTLLNLNPTMNYLLLYYDPVTWEEIQSAPSARVSLSQTYNLIAHQKSSAAPECYEQENDPALRAKLRAQGGERPVMCLLCSHGQDEPHVGTWATVSRTIGSHWQPTGIYVTNGTYDIMQLWRWCESFIISCWRKLMASVP